MLPAWLGAGAALKTAVDEGNRAMLEVMYYQWPFFRTRIGMLEMVFAKVDLWLAEYYDQRRWSRACGRWGKTARTVITGY